MAHYPTVSVDIASWETSPREPGEFSVTTVLDGGLAAHANVAVRRHARHIVVFLPGAQGPQSKRRVPFFHRWSWQEDLPNAHVIAIGDPAIALDQRILGAWFMHRDLDLIADMANFVGRIARTLQVGAESVTFHGSSLGGFGAIGMAAHLRGATAISEIPQIDVESWPVPSAVQLLGDLVGEPLSEFRKKRPERVDLLERIKHAKVIPAFALITNTEDASYGQQLEFMANLSKLSPVYEVVGKQQLSVTEVTHGHQPLPKEAALEWIRQLTFK